MSPAPPILASPPSTLSLGLRLRISNTGAFPFLATNPLPASGSRNAPPSAGALARGAGCGCPIGCLPKKIFSSHQVDSSNEPLSVWHLFEPLSATCHLVAKLRVAACWRIGDPNRVRSGNLGESFFLSPSLRPAPTHSLSALVSGGRAGGGRRGSGGKAGPRLRERWGEGRGEPELELVLGNPGLMLTTGSR